MSCEVPESAKQAGRRYTRGMMLAGGLYVGLVVLGVTVINRMSPPHWLVIVLALLPVLPALLMLRTYLTFFRALDEFQRRVQSEAALITLGVLTIAAFGYGFLEAWAGFPHVPLIWAIPAVIITWGVSAFFVRARYK